MASSLDRIDRFLPPITRFAKVDTQIRLLSQVRDALPPELSHQCLWANLKDDRLIIFAPSSAWAGRLRFCFREIQAHLETLGIRCERMDAKVLPPRARPSRDLPRPTDMSAASGEVLRQTAGLLDDPQLAAALLRLASHGGVKRRP